MRQGLRKPSRRNRLRPDEIGPALHMAGIPQGLQVYHGYKRNHDRGKEENKGLIKNKKFLKLTLSELRLPISSVLLTPLTCRIAFSRVWDPAFLKVHCGKSFGIEIRIHY